MKDLEAAGQALGEALLHKQRCRAEQHHLDPTLRARVLVPKAFDGFRPVDRLLHLVENEDRSARTSGEAGSLPLLRDPVRAAKGGFVGTGKTDGNGDVFGDL